MEPKYYVWQGQAIVFHWNLWQGAVNVFSIDITCFSTIILYELIFDHGKSHIVSYRFNITRRGSEILPCKPSPRQQRNHKMKGWYFIHIYICLCYMMSESQRDFLWTEKFRGITKISIIRINSKIMKGFLKSCNIWYLQQNPDSTTLG